MTLPVFFAISNAKPEDTLKVQTVLDDRDFRSVDRPKFSASSSGRTGLERTRTIAHNRYARRAIHLLEEFPAVGLSGRDHQYSGIHPHPRCLRKMSRSLYYAIFSPRNVYNARTVSRRKDR